MFDRRQFLGVTLATGVACLSDTATAGLLRRRRRPCNHPLPINDRVEQVVRTIRSCPEIASVDVHPVDDPTMALFQWRWSHFRHDLESRIFDEVNKVNEELRTAMKRVLRMPSGGLHKLLQEGLVEGKEKEYLANNRKLYADLAEQVLRDASDANTPVTPARIARAIVDGRIASRAVTQSWDLDNGGWRCMELPILSRIGVGNALAVSDGIQLLSSEDPEIDRNAEWAERHGTQSEYTRWVLDERNRWFVQCAIRMREELVHLLVGHSHDLRPEIQKVHATDGVRISHVVITPKSVRSIH